jgi:hypothetical protein
MAALLITGWSKDSNHSVAGMLIANALRFGVPLLALFAINASGGELADRGAGGLIVLFYLLTLVVEAPLSVLVVGTRGAAGDKGISPNG